MDFMTPIAQALLIALLASALCAVGIFVFFHEQLSPGVQSSRELLPKNIARYQREVTFSIITATLITIIVLIWTGSAVIIFPFSFFSFLITWIYLKSKKTRAQSALAHVWPEVIDHLISAIHSGLSLSEAMVGLAQRGPDLVRPAMTDFHQDLLRGENFEEATARLKVRFDSHSSDQILEAILLAKSLGGSELLSIFRTLGDFLRQDLSLRKEIEIKHGWIKNSAHLSSAAPWLLLLLLSSQPGTAQSFGQPTGIAILSLGVVLTLIAYFWMGRLGRLPKTPRVFG